jgi:hypothetical protein
MENDLKEKLQSLKANGKKKGGCSSCKKKKEVLTTLPDIIEEENIYVPTKDEIRLAYIELGNRIDNKQEFIGKVYRTLFDEEFNFGCSSCVNAQSRRLKNYIIEVLKMEV